MKAKYKKSRFNYIAENKGEYLVYNTLYNSLTRLSKDEYRNYCDLNFKDIEEQNSFIKQGIIIKKDADELKRYNAFATLYTKYFTPPPTITLAPTMDCNARCFYCYEKDAERECSSKIQADDILKFLSRLDLSRGIHLTFFGGEPLLNPEWIDYFIGLLNKENIEFSSFIITNGSLINDNIIEKMKRLWNIESVQISIDGNADEYAQRKLYKDGGELIYFDILKKIRRLSNNDINVQIRLNIDRENAADIIDTAEYLGLVFSESKNVTFYPAFLTGSRNPLTEREKIDLIKKLIYIDKNNKINVNAFLYKPPKTAACYFYQKNSFTIGPDGSVYICERKLGRKDKAIGRVDKDINIDKFERLASGKREDCQKCTFLPRCHGGCQDAYEAGDDPCFIERYIIPAYLESL